MPRVKVRQFPISFNSPLPRRSRLCCVDGFFPLLASCSPAFSQIHELLIFCRVMVIFDKPLRTNHQTICGAMASAGLLHAPQSPQRIRHAPCAIGIASSVLSHALFVVFFVTAFVQHAAAGLQKSSHAAGQCAVFLF